MLTVGSLRAEYELSRDQIRDRLDTFSAVWRKGDRAVFSELCFCILAANSSAQMGLDTLAAMGDLLWDGSVREIQTKLSGRFRYWRVRPEYIVATREFLRGACGMKLRDFIMTFPDSRQRREFFAESPQVRGIGYKESSHFLRNIGFNGYAILDKHILTCLRELGVIGRRLFPTNPRRYRLIEGRMIRFSRECGIGIDELDLVLWKHKTGKILK